MKCLILIALVLLSRQIEQEDAVEFIAGFINGMGYTDIDLSKLKKCIDQAMPFVQDISQLAEEIHTVDDVIRNVERIYTDLLTIFAQLNQCNIFGEIYDSLLLLTPDIVYVRFTIIIVFHFKEVKSITLKIITASQSDDYTTLGTEIGHLVELLFNADVKDAREAILKFIEGYMVGFFQGISVDYPKIMECITNEMDIMNYEIIYSKLVAALKSLESIDIFHLETIQKAVEGILDVVKTLATDIKPCIESFPELQTYWDKILLINPFILAMQVTKNIILHPGQMYNDLKGMYTSYKASDWFNVGKDIGDFLYNLILRTLNVNTVNDDLEFIKGMLLGLKQDGEDVEDILECVDDSTTIIKDIEAIIADIKQSVEDLKEKKIAKLIQDFENLFSAVRDLFIQVEPCAKMNKDVMKIINIFKGLTPKKIAEKVVMNLLKNAFKSYEDISKMVSDFQKKNYNDAGQMLGDLIYRVFLE